MHNGFDIASTGKHTSGQILACLTGKKSAME